MFAEACVNLSNDMYIVVSKLFKAWVGGLRLKLTFPFLSDCKESKRDQSIGGEPHFSGFRYICIYVRQFDDEVIAKVDTSQRYVNSLWNERK